MSEVQLEGYIQCDGCEKYYYYKALKNTKYGLVCFSCFVDNAEEEIGQLERNALNLTYTQSQKEDSLEAKEQ